MNSLRLLLISVLLLLPVRSAYAHRLEAEVVVRPFGQIQVEGWFETGDSAFGAKVQVFSGAGRLVAEGKLDSKGVFVFPYRETGALRVVVNGGGGHRAEVRLPAETLVRHAAASVAACLTPGAPLLSAALLLPARTDTPVAAEPLVERRSGAQVKNLLLGVSALLAVALLAVQWRRLRPGPGQAPPRTGAPARFEP